MCGIAGIYNRAAPGSVDKDLLGRMVGVLHHRGPDESGMYLDDRVGLGSARLSIIDLESGLQPIPNEDRSLWITFNGEIYNYREKRRELEARGHVFETATDTEVILHLYEEHGADCLPELNGQFAFAIWNSNTKELFLARDRVGIRPLYYTSINGQLVFASEIKALFLHNEIRREFDEHALKQIFTFWTTLPGRTVFRGIHELPAGHYLRITPNTVRQEQYWDVPYYPPSQRFSNSPGNVAADLRDLLMDAVKIRLQADVPVGTYLSGGLDSSGISAMAMKHASRPVTSYGIRFQEPEFNESQEQQTVSEFLGTDHRMKTVGNSDILQALPATLWHCEAPILRTAPVPLYLLSDKVREDGLKVVLTGEGADEVFGGYNIFREMKVRRFWARQPGSAFRYKLLSILYPYVFRQNNNPGVLRNIFGRHLTETGDPFYSHRLRWENTSRNQLYFQDSIRQSITEYDPYEDLERHLPDGFREWTGMEQSQYLEMRLFMTNYLLAAQGDRVAMANSVEVRLPFLDHRVLDFAARIPSHLKIRGLREKYILKKALSPFLPEKVLRRAKKPFRAPINKVIFKNHSLDSYVAEDNLEQYGIFDSTRVQKFVDILRMKRQPSEIDNMGLIGILSSQILHRQFIDHFQDWSGDVVLSRIIDNRANTTPVQEEI